MEKGTRIKFLQDITCSATGDHPAFLFAKKGELGTINEKLKNNAYSVYWDGWKQAPFIAEPHEFEACDGKENI
jgi:hypothetical protein